MTDAQTLLQEGLSAFRARAYDQALQAWRALLDADPDNQQVKQLVERTEALAAEGHLVHTLKEELADLREELATTRQARNELLIEMARVHKRYQARESRLWRLQEEREWELREALAHAELSSIVDDDAQNLHLELDALSELAQAPLPETLDDAHQQIQQLLRTLNQAHEQIHTLEAQRASSEREVQNASRRTAADEADTAKQDDSRSSKTADTHTRPSRTVPAKTDVNKALPPDSTEADDEPTPKRTVPHTQTSRTLAGSHYLVEPEEEDHPPEEEATSFDGPLIADEWLNAPTEDEHIKSLPDDLVSLVKVVSKTKKSRETIDESSARNAEEAQMDPSDASSDVKSTHDDDSEAQEPVDAENQDKQDTEADDDLHITDNAAELFKVDDEQSVDSSMPVDDSAKAPAIPNEEKPPPVPRRVAKTPPPSQPLKPRDIPDTAKIPAQPMEDTDIADGFSDELTSALGSTPAPQRLYTGVQPDLPDIDVLENEPQEMAPEDLEKHPTSVPVRYKEDPSIDDPIARYLLTHVDGVSTFMELRGTVGLPPAAVDRGFRILLAHKVIRVQH